MPMAPHMHRLMLALSELLKRQRVAALATLAEDGAPFVSMVPYAIDAGQAARHAPVVFGAYLMNRLDANYDYRKRATAGA